MYYNRTFDIKSWNARIKWKCHVTTFVVVVAAAAVDEHFWLLTMFAGLTDILGKGPRMSFAHYRTERIKSPLSKYLHGRITNRRNIRDGGTNRQKDKPKFTLKGSHIGRNLNIIWEGWNEMFKHYLTQKKWRSCVIKLQDGLRVRQLGRKIWRCTNP